MAQSQSRPLWRMAFDSADRLIGPASEQLVRTEAFADLIGLASRLRYVALKRTERALRQQWHVWNLPASTDVRRLSEQVASLERQVRNLTRELEDGRRPPRGGALDAAPGDTTGGASTNGAPACVARTGDKAASGVVPSLTELFSPTEVATRVRRDVERSVLRARNGIKHVAGIDRARVGLTPKDTVWARHKVELWHYQRPDGQPVTLGPPILLVMSLVSRSYVLDLRPGNSVVEYLMGEGFDVYMLDWGVPDEVEAGNTLETYCDEYLPRAVEAVCEDSGSPDVTMWGYCFGGLLSVLSVAGNPEMAVRNLLVMATPTDFQHMGPMSSMLQEGRIEPDAIIDETGNVPADVIRGSFKVLKPTADLASYANLWENLWNDEFVEGYQAMTQWANDHIPFPGACFRQTAELFNRRNALAAGEVRLGLRAVRLADITVPFLNVVGEADHIVPPDAVGPLASLVGSTDAEELRLPAGHVGLVVGKGARRRMLPAMAEWVRRHSDPVVVAAP